MRVKRSAKRAAGHKTRSRDRIGGDIFWQLFERSRAVLLILNARDGRVMHANAAAAKFYGWTRAQLKTKRIWDLNPLPRETLEEKLLEVVAGKGNFFKFQHRTAAGELRDIESFTTPIGSRKDNLIFSIIHDVTEGRHAEDSLRLAKRALEFAPVGIIISDAKQPDHPIIYANPAFEILTGYPQAEVIGRNSRFLQGTETNQPEIAHLRVALKEGRSCEVVLRNYKKDGSMFWNQLQVAPVVDALGVITHYVGTQTDISARKMAEARIEQLAFFDGLTELPNRRLFLDRLDNTLFISQRNNLFGAVAFLDLDNFKHLNDSQGLEVGDQLLREIGRRLRQCLRSEDTLSRLGGDEFAVLLPGLSDNDQMAGHLVQAAITRLQQAILEPVKLGSFQHQIAASIGVTIFPKGTESASDLLKQADTAMYRAKAMGRNSVCYFEPTMQVAVNTRLTMEHDLREAMERHDFRIFLQPQVDIAGKIIGAEALLRWDYKDGGLISPLAFIPLAEETGLIIPIGQWVLQEACRVSRQLEQAGHPMRISVNVSPRQFRSTDYANSVANTLRESGANPDRVMLEITEAVIFDSISDAREKMRQLRELGVHFSIDDFGTGYASLSYLKNLPLTELKIDRSFIQDAPTDPNDASLVEAILAVAHHHGLQVVAEGVETIQQVAFLKERGCPLFQGYYFGRPMPEREFCNTLPAQ